MTKKWIGINLLLLVIAAAAAWQLKVSVQQYNKDNDLSNIQPAGPNQKTAQGTILPPSLAEKQYNPMEFEVIPEKNVFSETRTSESSGESTSVAGTMPDSQKPILVGVISTEYQKVASIREPPTRGASSQVQMRQVGETYEEYTVTEIARDHIVLVNGNQKETIYLNDPSQPVQRARANVVATRVIPIGSSTSAAANTQTYTVYDSRTGTQRQVQIPAATRAANTGANAGENSAQGNTILVIPGGQTGTQQPDASQSSGQLSATQVQTPTTGGTQRGSRLIRTPVGDIIRNPQGQ